MKSLTGLLLKTGYENQALGVTAGAVSVSLPIVPLAVLSAALAIDAVAMPLAWLTDPGPLQPPKPKTRDDLVREVNDRLNSIIHAARQVQDSDTRNSIIAQAEIEHRHLLAQIMSQ